MRKILVLQHVAYEILGTLNPLLKKEGFRIKYLNFDRYPDLTASMEGYNGLIVLGGPMGVGDTDQHPHLFHECQLIEQALKASKPVLGICLGAQLLAHVLGAPVKRNPETEIGWKKISTTQTGESDEVIGHLGKSTQTFQWHHDTFDIPSSSTILATGDTCQNQAFREGKRVYGLQFHLEVDRAMIDRWLTIKDRLAELSRCPSSGGLSHIQTQTQHHIDHSVALSELVFGSWINLFDKPPKRVVLTSGHR